LNIQDILKSDLLPVVTGLYENPHLVVDIRGNIFFYNKPAEELLSLTSADNNIFDLFSGPTSELFYSILKGTYREKEQPVVVQLALKNGDSKTIQMRYTFIDEGENRYFSCTFSSERLKFRVQPDIKVTAEIDPNVNPEILDLIKRNYPFTLMGKDLVRKKIDELHEFFWIKDLNGKFILVNKAFSAYLGMQSTKIEGTEEEKFIPSYLKKMAASIEDYISSSGKAVKITGIMTGISPYGKERLEIPLLNGEDKVYAIAGMTLPSAEAVPNGEGDLIEYIPKTAAIFDTAGKLLKYTEEFKLFFNIDKKNRNIHYGKLFPSELSDFVDGFIKSGVKEELRSFTGNDFIRKVFSSGYTVFLRKGGRPKDTQVLVFIDEIKSNQDMQEFSSSKGKIYDILIQSNPEPIFIYEKENLRFIEVNPAALTLYGYSKSEFLQMDLTDLYAPEDIQTLLGALNHTITEGVYTGPFRQRKKDGTFLHVEISKFSLKFNNKESHYNILRDVTRKLETEKESQLFKSAFDHSEQLMFITDSSGFIKSVNNAVISSLGYKRMDLEKISFAALVRDEERGNINSSVFRTAKKETKKISLDIKNSKGDFIPAELTATPLFDFKNEIDTFTILASLRNKENIKEITKEIVIERIMPAEQQVQGDNVVLLSSIFHEILTPINVILGFVQELTDSIDALSPEQKEAADIINQNRMSLLNTMNSVVEYYNIEKKTPELTYTRITPREIFDNLQNDFTELNRSRGIEIGYGKVVSSFYFETDKSKFSNLLFLLVKIAGYMNREKKIFISFYPLDKDRFVITFRNNQDRITPAYLEDLIRVFSQGGSNESSIPKLSLRLANRLLNLFHGEIYIKEDNTEAGFVFPVNPAKMHLRDMAKSKAEETYVPPAKGKITLQPAPLKKPPLKDTFLKLSQLRCLYIEDQVDSQILYKVQMKELGDIQFAVSFEEALPLLDKGNFDFIVMDINLEGEYNGLDALRIIQKMPEYKNIPVIAVTAYLMPGDREKFISAGFNEFVPKPIFRDKMIEALERVFKRR
jgi:PAS domain S-box-containing protein